MIRTFGELKDAINSINVPNNTLVFTSSESWNYYIESVYNEKIDEYDLDAYFIDDSMLGKDAVHIDLK
jgi:hypothetical protein